MRRAPQSAIVLRAACAVEVPRPEAAGLPADRPRVPAPSDVRAAQLRIPRVASDAEDGGLVRFYVGTPARGGSRRAGPLCYRPAP